VYAFASCSPSLIFVLCSTQLEFYWSDLHVADARKLDWKLIVAIIAFIIGPFLGIFAGTLWRRADVVFDKRSVEIPLSDPLRKNIEDALAQSHSDSLTVAKNGQQVSSSTHLPSAKLPDKLLYVNLRNVGHVPSAEIKVRIVVPGQIADKAITDAGSAFGKIGQLAESDSTSELSFECQNFVNDPAARIKVALWYQQNSSSFPSVQIEDTSEGAAREVSSVDTARFFWFEWSNGTEVLVAVFVGLSGITLGYALSQLWDRRRMEKFMERRKARAEAIRKMLENPKKET
jgi:hypothetical protein